MNIKHFLNDKLKETFDKLGYNTELAVVAFCGNNLADLQCNAAFALAKELKTSPLNIANNIIDNSENLKDVCDLSCVNGFLNIKLKNEFLSNVSNDCKNSIRLNVPKLKNPKNIILDYGGANVAKPLHVGHMRSAIIGEALKRLNIFLGNSVVSDVHLGDWGLQMGLTIAQLMDDYDMGYYFGAKVPKIDITLSMLDDTYVKASTRKKDDEEFYDRASKITLLLQRKEKGYYDIWQEMMQVSLDMVKSAYSKFGATFDLWKGESSVNDLVPYVIDLFESKGLAKKSEGALIVDVADGDENAPMPPLLLQKSNGAQMYPVTEIATIVERIKLYNPDEIVYITDARQALHFKQVFKACKMAEIVTDRPVLKHYTFGTVNGKDGKAFKTRDGGTFKLEDLIDLVTNKALEKLKENKTEIDNVYELARQIGIAALIFGDLSNIISKDYIFDLDKFMTFEGKTGPYLQYTTVRINSILQKSDYVPFDIVITDETRDIVIKLLKLIDSFEVAYKECSLHNLALSIFDLCSEFSTFYNNVKILSTEDYETRQSYLNLCKLVYNALKLSLDILSIQVPEKM